MLDQEPLVRIYDFFVKCFQFLPETPINALGINREVHFDAGSPSAWDAIGDVLAPKEFWGDFVRAGDRKLGGLRSLTMEQAFVSPQGRRQRLDGKEGSIQVRVEPSVPVPNGVFVAVNDHYEPLATDGLSNGRLASELVASRWDASIQYAESLIDRVMRLV
jgi:hypothetical protein